MKPLNVVFIGRLSFPLGIATTKRRRYIVDYLNEQNISCKVIGLRQKDSSKFNNPEFGFYGNAEYINLSKLFYSGFKGKFSYFLKVNRCLRDWYRVDCDNIIVFQTNLELELLPFFVYARRLGYKVVFDKVEMNYTSENAKSISYLSDKYYRVNSLLSKWADKRAKGFFVISSFLWSEKKKEYPDMPLCLLPNATEIFNETPKRSFSEVIKILYTGTFAMKDGVTYLIEAFIKLEKQYPNVQLVLIGKGIDADMSVVKRLIDGNPKVFYLGFVDDNELKDNLLNADILAMTRCNSKFANYGFPFKLSEYLSTGNPVIATKVSDVEKYLKDKVNACLVEPEDTNSIFEGLKFLIENEKKAIEIGFNGLKVAKDKFSIHSNGEIFVDFLYKI